MSHKAWESHVTSRKKKIEDFSNSLIIHERKQSKSLPWWRFGYVILIIIKFGEVLLWFSPWIINALRSYIKQSKEYFIRYPNTSKLVKKARLRLVSSTHFSVFGYLMKHSSSCLIYYLKESSTLGWKVSSFQFVVVKPVDWVIKLMISLDELIDIFLDKLLIRSLIHPRTVLKTLFEFATK